LCIHGAQVPARGEQEAVDRAVEARREAGDVGEHELGGEVDVAVGGLEDLRQARDHRPHVDAVRRVAEGLEAQAVGDLAVAVAERTGTDLEVEEAQGSPAR
jgi:hypothetical protein